MSLRRPRFEDEEPASAINISPLIDVIFILLIFFIVTMVFAENDAMGVDAPRASNSQSPDSAAAVVSITSDGSVAIGRDRYSLPALKIPLGARLAKSSGTLVINADSSVPVKRLVEVMDCAKECGAREIYVATRKK